MPDVIYNVNYRA